MSGDTEFVDGLIVKAPKANAPSFVKASISIKREELIEWLQGREGDWINVDVKESKNGKWYAAVDNWKPSSEAPKVAVAASTPALDAFDSDDVPF